MPDQKPSVTVKTLQQMYIRQQDLCVHGKEETKEKKHPSGYVELLEARLDILTRLLEKLIELSRPHLQFIDDIITEENWSIKKNLLLLHQHQIHLLVTTMTMLKNRILLVWLLL